MDDITNGSHDLGGQDRTTQGVADQPSLFRDNRMTFAAGALAFSLLAGGLGWAWAGNAAGSSTQASSSITTTAPVATGAYPSPGSAYAPGAAQGGLPALPQDGAQRIPYGDMNAADTSSLAGLDVDTPTDEQTAGIVVIETDLGYSDGEAAGTGIVLTEDGLVLTNHHVVAGATSISVTTADGATHTAELVGSDANSDVALLELTNASGLTVAETDSAPNLTAGDAVTAIGNALGQGLAAAPGTVTALDQTITTQDEGTVEGQELSGLIEIDADVVSGDSGGAVLDADGDVIGLTTAASSGTRDIAGYAIDIDDALAIVDEIQAGSESGTIAIGYPAFLGIGLATDETTAYSNGTLGLGLDGAGGTSLSTTSNGVEVAEVYPETAAAAAGIVSGDLITAVDGVAVASQDELSAAIGAHDPGDIVEIAWSDSSGASHNATAALTRGPVA
ncbi:hypothetical protein GCM10010401_06690 [Rarobacter faecitabidus]|uniref:S1-C subfamily serine protease n=1 Tax=Rarobacter faecitabidus TaxID=13243 RepID=A0A542ZT98_RARFA|nr:trypsin-like peptidase domain-containing protein [Rarobacter faecitabidus]TQL63583.1 S1-C subfamily serine protease [Rarobacter faecitabidus]